MIKIGKIDLELLRDQDPDFARSVFRLHREFLRSKNETKDAMISEKVAWTENLKLKAELEANKKEVEILSSIISQHKSRYEQTVRNYHQAQLQLDSAELKSAQAEASLMNLMEALEKQKEEIFEKYAESVPTAVRKQMQDNITMITEQVIQILKEVKIPEGRPPQPAVIIEPKK